MTTPRNLSLTKLPMPPGINQSDLESIDSPPSGAESPPEPHMMASMARKMGIVRRSIKDLPMPPDDDDESSLSHKSKSKLKRPRVIGRDMDDLGPMAPGGKDWGERCVDVFEVIDQIGEGTYGQVYKAKDNISGEYSGVIKSSKYRPQSFSRKISTFLLHFLLQNPSLRRDHGL
jgi:cyclin-dependent kinase 12/13